MGFKTVKPSENNTELAQVFVAELQDGSLIEFAEAVTPPHPRESKWVLIISTLKGCPVSCPICDAGGDYRGKLTSEELLEQVDWLVRRRYPDGQVPARKLKVQFARMGDPAFNDAVLDALDALPGRLNAHPGIIPSISTIAPAGREDFFERLLEIKNRLFSAGRFQMQFSLHTTSEARRRDLVPARTWTFAQMSAWSLRFRRPEDRKVTLNFAPARGCPLEPERLLEHFPASEFLVKLTPINPTRSARASGLAGLIDPADPAACETIAARFRVSGYETILSIGELEENSIGSNCGMIANSRI